MLKGFPIKDGMTIHNIRSLDPGTYLYIYIYKYTYTYTQITRTVQCAVCRLLFFLAKSRLKHAAYAEVGMKIHQLEVSMGDRMFWMEICKAELSTHAWNRGSGVILYLPNLPLNHSKGWETAPSLFSFETVFVGGASDAQEQYVTALRERFFIRFFLLFGSFP